MKFVKEEDENREDYIFQENTKTKVGASIIIIALVVITIAILGSAWYFGYF